MCLYTIEIDFACFIVTPTECEISYMWGKRVTSQGSQAWGRIGPNQCQFCSRSLGLSSHSVPAERQAEGDVSEPVYRQGRTAGPLAVSCSHAPNPEPRLFTFVQDVFVK